LETKRHAIISQNIIIIKEIVKKNTESLLDDSA